jgi:glycosyltransferase involved in cell wall biosynthesis
VLHAGFISRPDVLHLQAIGPALWTPLARLLGLRVVVTHHGPDYARQKWGGLARTALRAGEAAAARWANALVVISGVIQDDVAARHGRRGALIPNGVSPAGPAPSPTLLEAFGLRANHYILLVSRLVPEKRHHDLIAAFARAGLPRDWQLVLTGAADHADAYAASVQTAAAQVPGVVLTGFQTGEALRALYAHAGLFVLPSSHEGLPIALLEALSWGRPVVASDIAAHRDLGLPPDHLFTLGDIDALALRLTKAAAGQISPLPADWVTERFDWDRSARQTLEVYRSVAKRPADAASGAHTAWNARS